MTIKMSQGVVQLYQYSECDLTGKYNLCLNKAHEVKF